MEELLRYIDEQIEILIKTKRHAIDEDGNELECFDGEAIYSDGNMDGQLRAYYDISQRLKGYINQQNK